MPAPHKFLVADTPTLPEKWPENSVTYYVTLLDNLDTRLDGLATLQAVTTTIVDHFVTPARNHSIANVASWPPGPWAL